MLQSGTIGQVRRRQMRRKQNETRGEGEGRGLGMYEQSLSQVILLN